VPIYILFFLMEKLATADNRKRTKFSNYMQIGLIFSSFGDISLELEPVVGDILFVVGLANFLIAHWFYVAAFSSDTASTAIFWCLFAYGYAGCFFFVMNSGDLPEKLKVPVAAYAFSIATMAWMAIRRIGSKNSTSVSQYLGVLGAIIFVISDSFIGYNRFVSRIPFVKHWVMITYYSAQYCLTMSTNGIASGQRSKSN
jgi:alkenylglycerophosphocholine hydrolase